MKSGFSLAVGAFLVSGALAGSLPACSAKSVTPCACPKGTEYSESSTFSIIGAETADVEALVNDFFNPAWLGAVPYATTGPNNKVGSTRTSNFSTPIGYYDLSEKLVERKVEKDKSFIQVFEQLQSTIPLKYHDGTGSFSGSWITLQGTHVFQYTTLIRWSVYACETGHPRSFAQFHEVALNNATSLLTAAGKIKGVNVAPFSVQAF